MLHKCAGPALVMTGMTSLLLRVLFSSRPVALREVGCVGQKKKREKSVLESRCLCKKCLLKRRRAKPNSVPEQEPETKQSLDGVRTRSRTQPQYEGSEEIVLKVTNFQH